MKTEHPYWTYSGLSLTHQLGTDEPPSSLYSPGPGIREKNLAHALQRLERSGHKNLLLIGLGAGCLAADLATALPPDITCVVCELDPGHVRQVIAHTPQYLHWWSPESKQQLLVDLSPWALLLLLVGTGFPPRKTLAMLNPELEDEQKRNQLRLVQRIFSAATPWRPEHARTSEQRPTLSAAAILHPEEPDLEGFFRQFPDWLHELVLVWDAAQTPPQMQRHLPSSLHVTQIARPLDLDFGVQRNVMLGQCSGDWVLYLDADERLAPKSWDSIPSLLGPESPEGFFFPRMTLHPDNAHCMAGLGLWPDLQLRLFKNIPGIGFERTVQEQLRGLQGKRGLLPKTPLLHLSHLNKSQAVLTKKLELFNKAANHPGMQHLNPKFPHLSIDFFDKLSAQSRSNDVLLVPFATER